MAVSRSSLRRRTYRAPTGQLAGLATILCLALLKDAVQAGGSRGVDVSMLSRLGLEAGHRQHHRKIAGVDHVDQKPDSSVAKSDSTENKLDGMDHKFELAGSKETGTTEAEAGRTEEGEDLPSSKEDVPKRFPEFDEEDLAFFMKARNTERKRLDKLKKGKALGSPKVAFMFLSRGPMPLDAIWERFFKGHEDLYSTYILAPPGFEYNASTTSATAFYGKQIKTNFVVGWASNNVLRAERRLLAAALAEPRNYMFVLLSESCTPLWNLTYIHSYLTRAQTSFIASVGTDMRWEQQYEPEIPRDSWRKGSQWFALLRDHALVVINDTVVFDAIVQRSTQYILNEHYVQTLVPMHDPDRVENRPVTYVEWRPGNFFHPHSYTPLDMHKATFKAMRTQSMTNPVKFTLYPGWRNQTACTLAGKRQHCFLFGRKFNILTRNHLLHFAETMFYI